MSGQNKYLAYEEEQRRFNFVRIWQKRYAHMKARHEGRSTSHSCSQGKGLMTKEEFFDWCKDFDNLQEFLTIYFSWVQNGFNRWDSPSIDRIHPDQGYVAGNIQWMSYGDNCIKNNIDPITHKRVKVFD